MQRLAPFPAVAAREKRAGRSYEDAWERWRRLPMRPLRITAALSSPYIPASDGAIHLDGILTAAVMASPEVAPRCDKRDDVTVPLPIAVAWVSEEGHPLWIATDFIDPARHKDSEIYIHKRHPTDYAHLSPQMTVNTSAGRYRDVRMPLRVSAAPRIEAYCIGNLMTISSLLDDVTHVGRKGAIGCGHVIKWTVDPAEVDTDWITQRRMVPVAYLADRGSFFDAGRLAPRAGWTPPYWDARRHAACRRPAWTT